MEAFAAIRTELQRRPLEVNRYRSLSGDGRSQAFGIVNRRCLPPDYSRNCWNRPYLYSLLLEFGDKYVKDISWNAITVNQNYRAEPHRDKGNRGNSFLVAFGSYAGGELEIHDGELIGKHNIWCTPIITDFKECLHSVKDFEGERYSLVYYNANVRNLDLPPPMVLQHEDGKFYFYRGAECIDPDIGLPHPLKKRSK
tara:strand:+ start:534 stop:1124 length:591 start_codon:yes stop_codon:yes gene_type:complete